MLAATNNCKTKHLAKILIHLAWCLQECVSASDVASLAFTKALNALSVSSVFLKYLIENTRSDNFEELYLSLSESDPVPNDFSEGYTFVLNQFSLFPALIVTFFDHFTSYSYMLSLYGLLAYAVNMILPPNH